MDALTITNLSYSYIKGEKTINNISLSVKQGQYVSLLGHNGSGKSTLAKLIDGLLPLDSGKIEVMGLELNEANLTKIRNKVAIVFQNPDNQFIGITVEDDIAFSLENRNVPREEMKQKVVEYAEKVGMKEYLTKEPSYLSGGQKQRVAIADALVINPEILILDEATSMLDPQGKKEIHEIIAKMRIENPSLTVISVTHDVEEAYLSDEIILLERGEVVKVATPYDLFTDEEVVDKYHLDIPFEIAIKKKLKEEGIAISGKDKLQDIEEKICLLK